MMIEKELERVFALSFGISEHKEKNGLPRYLTTGRKIYKAQYEQFGFYIIKLPSAIDSRVLYKEKLLYEEKFGVPVAFCFETLTKNNRNAYVKHHIPFLMVPTQIYLPFLGILFSKKFIGAEGSAFLQLTANAQLILLYLVYNKKADYTKKELAVILGLDPVYVTRGTKELVSRRFIAEKRKGRSVEVGLTIDSKELFNVASSVLSSPIRDVIYVRKTEDVIGLPKASDFALSEISMINPPEIAAYACFKKSRIVDKFEIVDEPGWEKSSEICKVELWNYDPVKLCENGIVDKLSLYASLKDTKDPRVQGELENVLEELSGSKWFQ